MKRMKINEIFYSLQGEGYFTGTPAVFLRMSGCNMKCSFCDTQHEEGREMTEEEIVKEVSQYPARHIVITGGEPTMQLNERLITLLHQEGFFIQIETNGTNPLPGDETEQSSYETLTLRNGQRPTITGVDWVTCSPKGNEIRIQRIDELKLLFLPQYLNKYNKVEAKVKCLQPVDNGNVNENVNNLRSCIEYIKKHPEWRMSLQTHKMIDIQ